MAKGKVYIFNSLIVPVNFNIVSEANITLRLATIREIKELLQNYPFISAIGHESTANVLSQLLGFHIPANRITVFMDAGDIGIHFFLKARLPEGKILAEEELKSLDYWFVISTIEATKGIVYDSTPIQEE